MRVHVSLTSRVLLLINVSESVYFSIKSLVWRWQVSLLESSALESLLKRRRRGRGHQLGPPSSTLN